MAVSSISEQEKCEGLFRGEATICPTLYGAEAGSTCRRSKMPVPKQDIQWTSPSHLSARSPWMQQAKTQDQSWELHRSKTRALFSPYSVTSNQLFKHSDEDMRWVCPNQQWRHKDSNTDSQVSTRCGFAYRTRQTEAMNPGWQQTRVCQGGAEGLIPKGLEGFHSKMVRAFCLEGSG